MIPQQFINEHGQLVTVLLHDTDATDIVDIAGNLAIVDEESGEILAGEMV